MIFKSIKSIPQKSYRLAGIRVSITNHYGIISLRYSYNSTEIRHNLGIGYFNLEHQKIAQAIARQIHDDIYVFNRYDESRNKYRLKPIIIIEDKFTIFNCWELYQERKKLSDSQKLNRIKPINKIFTEYPELKELDPDNLDKLVSLIFNNYSDSTAKGFLFTLSASINLAIALKKISITNPLPEIIKSIKLKKSSIKFYSFEEIQEILKVFKEDNKHNYYYHFVLFRILTGSRPSEVIPLTWNDIITKDKKQYIRFNKRRVLNNTVEGTKNGKDFRLFPINKELQNLLNSITNRDEKLIFISPRGTYIDSHDFVNVHWNIVIEQLYKQGKLHDKLPFYNLRHYFCNQLIRSGTIDLKTIAYLVGNSPEVLIKEYLGINTNIDIPNIF